LLFSEASAELAANIRPTDILAYSRTGKALDRQSMIDGP